MEGQTSIPTPNVASEIGACWWCGTPTTQRLTLEKASWSTQRGVKVMRRAAREAWCCPDHLQTLERREGSE